MNIQLHEIIAFILAAIALYDRLLYRLKISFGRTWFKDELCQIKIVWWNKYLNEGDILLEWKWKEHFDKPKPKTKTQ